MMRRFAVTSTGDAPDLFVVKFIDPLESNRAAWGFDIGSEPVRRAAINRAIESGEPTLRVVLRWCRTRAGGRIFLYLMPIYRTGPIPARPWNGMFGVVGLILRPWLSKRFRQFDDRKVRRCFVWRCRNE